MSIKRERLSPEESRAAALVAARGLLIERGPQAVTLKAVAAEIGKSHANLLHHFGSAAGLQAALAASLSDKVCAEIALAVQRARAHEIDPIEIVDRTFDAFDKEGAGALAAWMILSGNRDALNPILDAIHAGTLASAPTQPDPIFGIHVVTHVPHVPSEMLIPEHTWADKESFAATAKKLAGLFVANFKKFEDGAAPEVKAAGPRV